MAFIKKQDRKRICIICKKRKKQRSSLFCKVCVKKDIFVKIKALRESQDYKEGWINTGMQQKWGRLPKR